jgi:hypothetical protein
LEKDDEINFLAKKYEHLKLNLNDKKKNYISKSENYAKLIKSNLQMKKLITFLIKIKIEKEKE